MSLNKLVALVNTNQVKPPVAPIAFDYLHPPLERAGFKVEILDLCFCADLELAIDTFCQCAKPDFWGVTLRNTDDVYFGSGHLFLPLVKRVVEGLRRASAVPVIVGGVGYSVMPERLLAYLGADFGIVCEGEVSFPTLLQRLVDGEPYDDIPGLVYRNGKGIQRNPVDFADLETLGQRWRTLIDNPRYFKLGGQAGIETKRGCNRRCIYCVEPLAKGQRIRFRTPSQIVDEMESLLGQGVNVFHVNDSEFNLSIQHALAFCQEVRRRGLHDRIEWYAYGMPAPFPDALAAGMRAAGCVGMNFGVDSASETMLAVLKRTFTVADIEQAVATAKRHGLQHIVELLLGAPGETAETVKETIDCMKRIAPDQVAVTVGLRVFPGTELERMVRQEGIHRDNPNLYGEIEDNDDLLKPLFYLSAAIGPDPLGYIARLTDGDPRFLGVNTDQFNYNANELIANAVANGERGAYWSILGRIRERLHDARKEVETQRTTALVSP